MDIQRMSDMISIPGGCHCGVIRYVINWPRDESNIPVRQCGCTFCQKHGGSWTSNPRAELIAEISDNSKLSRYRFGTATADFFVCSSCGNVPFVSSEIDGKTYSVVNVNTFENTDGLTFSVSATDFEGEDTDSRLERRKRNWISAARITVARN